MRSIFALIFCVLFSAQIVAQDWSERFTSLFEEGDALYYANDFESASLKFEVAKQIAADHLGSNEIYRSVFAIMSSQRMAGNPNDAKSTLIAGISDYKSVLESDQLSTLHNYVGLIENQMGDYESAIQSFETALTYSKSVKDTLRIGNQLINKSISYIYLNRYDEAELILDQAGELDNQDPALLAFLNLTYFNIYNYRNEDLAGYEYLIKAYEYSKQSSDTRRYLNVLVYMANHNLNQNNYRQGLAYATEGNSLARAEQFPTLVARFSDILGRLYSALSENELAINFYNEALNIYEQNENEALTKTLKIQISDLLIKQKELDIAEDLLTELIGSDLGILQRNRALLGLSDIEEQRGNYQKSKEYLDLALGELDDNNIANSRYIFDRYVDNPIIAEVERLEYARESYLIAQSRGKLEEMKSEIVLSKLFESINPDSSFKFAYRAISKLEDRRFSTSASSIKEKLNINWQSFYYQVADWEIEYNQDYEKAFELFELSKSRSLFDQIVENQQANLLSQNDPASIKVLELQKRIDQSYRELSNTFLSGQSSEDLMEISQLELEYQAAIDELIASKEEWSAIEYPDVSELEDVQGQLDENTAYLNYGIRQNQLFIYMVKDDERYFFTDDSRDNVRSEITDLVNDFRDGIINLDDESTLASLSEQITDIVIEPFADQLDGIYRLIISPDGPLHLLPFEALILNDQYLIERFTIKYVPSISIYDAIEYPNASDFNSDLLAMAGSGFESGDGFFASSSQASFATLPYALAEVDSISNYFSNTTILKNEEVTEVTFKNLSLSDYRFIHLATHGNIDERLPDQSGLILSKKIGTESLFGEDGYLNAREITQLDIPAELVVLSACNTGTGKVLTGEGVMGLQRAMLSAGASSVIVSLWNIFDRSTPLFMDIFYENLLEIEEEELSFLDRIKQYADLYEPDLIDYKTLALQRAKLEMIDHPYYNHPVHWAPFVITGK